MTRPDPRTAYTERIARLDVRLASGERQHHRISNLRLALFAAGAAVAWAAFIRASLSPAWLVLPALAFLALLVAHARLLNSNERLRRARRYYERGLSRLDGTWPGTGPDGARFLGEHLYTRDLDLFGREARCFGLDGDLRRDEVWEHVEPGMSRDMDTVSK